MTNLKPITKLVLLFGITAFACGQEAPPVNLTAKQSPCANIVALSGGKGQLL